MRINGKNVGGLRINGKVVGGMRIGGKLVDLGAAPATAEYRFNYRHGGRYSITLYGVTFIFRMNFFDAGGGRGQFIGFNFDSNQDAANAWQYWEHFTIVLGGVTLAPYTYANIIESAAAGVSRSGEAVITYPVANPVPPSDHLLEETLNSVTIAAGRAWGVFGGLSWSFDHGGRTYRITHCFTDQNGLQLRFQDQATAQAFIAANLEVDSGITGQAAIRSGTMTNAPPLAARAGPTFAGRYAANTSYTVTISA